MAVRTVRPTVANVGKNQGGNNLIRELLGAYNGLATAHNALLAKLDADAGITDEDYVAEIGEADTLAIQGEADAPS